jgi:hypothetical protein
MGELMKECQYCNYRLIFFFTFVGMKRVGKKHMSKI